MAISQSAIKNEIVDFHGRTGNYTGLLVAITAEQLQKEAAKLWKNIIVEGFSGIVPGSTTVSAAGDLIETLLTPINSGIAIQAHFAACMSLIGSGMISYTTTKQPDALVLSAPFPSVDISAEVLAGQIASTGKTGKSQLIFPPNTEVEWS